MISVTTARLQDRVQEYFLKIEETGEDLIVTRDEIPVFKIVSLQKKQNVDVLFADVRGKVKYHKNILEPETDEWGAI